MNRICLMTLLGWLVLNVISTQAQSVDGAIRVGGFLGYGTNSESLGIGIRGDYAVTHNMLIAPDFLYFFGDNDFGIETGWWDINLNGNYLIELNNPDLIPYVLAGLNVASISVDCNHILESVCNHRNDTDLGFNVGGGVDYMVGNIIWFSELRLVLGKADQLVIMTGLKFPLN